MNAKQLATNIKQIQTQVEAYKAQLIAVTKFVDADTTRQVVESGVTHLGENRSDKFLEKKAALSDLQDQITWHFIGHLQSRQVKLIINELDYLHSLDRLSLAKEIQKRATSPVKCFLQVNVSGEESKGGFEPDQVMTDIEAIQAYDKVQIIGLMTMAPIDATDDQLHRYFSHLKQLQVQVAERQLAWAPCQEISMGMSRDFPIALEEGATWVRVGTALYQE